MDKRRQFKKQYEHIPKLSRTAYGILNILPPNLEENREEYDKKLKVNFEKLRNEVLLEIEKPETGIVQLNDALDRMAKLDKSYELIKDHEARTKYELYLKYKKQKNERKQQVEDRYYHKGECDYSLIKNYKKQDHSIQGKMVMRGFREAGNEYPMEDSENRNLRVQLISDVGYRTQEGNTQYVYLYKVNRNIGGVELTDLCYSTESITEMLFNKRGGIPFDKKYLKAIANQLFSEELIEGSKYNNRFVAGLEKDEKGDYHPTLRKQKLPQKDKEALTAILTLEEKENDKQNAK